MADTLTLPLILRMLGFTLLGFVAISMEIAPLGLTANAMPSPDILFCLTAYCALRRPEAVPMLLVFALGLSRDLLTDAPPGAGALTLVLAAVFLMEARGWFIHRPFWMEWLCVTIIFAATLAVQWLLLAATFARPAVAQDLAWLLIITAGSYVFVALLLRVFLQVGYADEKTRLGSQS
ncbi:MAG: hypothetical protein AAGE80_06060 [Pseudomonadota bacterium]